MRTALPKTRFVFEDETKDTVVRKLCDAEFQFGLGQTAPKLKALESAPCGNMKFAIFGSSKVLNQLKCCDEKSFLQEAKWGMLDENTVLGKTMRLWFLECSVQPEVQIVCRANQLLAEAVKLSGILAVLPEQAESLFNNSDVVKASVPAGLAARLDQASGQLYLIWNRRTAQVRPGFERIINAVKSVLTARPCPQGV
jgi:hypothetical protein